MLVAGTSVSTAFVQPGQTHGDQPFADVHKRQLFGPNLWVIRRRFMCDDHEKYVRLGWLALPARLAGLTKFEL